MPHLVRRLAGAGQGVESDPLLPRRHAGVRQEYDRRLQTFRAVHCHDAHLVTLLLHVALDLDVARAELIDEAL